MIQDSKNKGHAAASSKARPPPRDLYDPSTDFRRRVPEQFLKEGSQRFDMIASDEPGDHPRLNRPISLPFRSLDEEHGEQEGFGRADQEEKEEAATAARVIREEGDPPHWLFFQFPGLWPSLQSVAQANEIEALGAEAWSVDHSVEPPAVDHTSDSLGRFFDPQKRPQTAETPKTASHGDQQPDTASNAQDPAPPTSLHPQSLLPTSPLAYKSGKIGKIRIHQSGRVTMRIGFEVFELDFCQSACQQELMCNLPYQNEVHMLGKMERTFVVRPLLKHIRNVDAVVGWTGGAGGDDEPGEGE